MADLTVTAADVRPLPGCITRRFVAGGTINVGSPVYMSAAGTIAAADGSAVSTSFAIGVLVATSPDAASRTALASGEYGDVVLFGPISGCATTYNKPYYVDDDAGVMADATGTKTTVVGIGLGNGILLVCPHIVSFS